MGLFYLQNSIAVFDTVDASSLLKKITAPKVTVKDLDSTPFGPGNTGWVQRIGGLRDVEFSAEGMYDGTTDITLFSQLGNSIPVTLCPQGAETNVAFLMQNMRTDYELFGQIGEIAPFKIGAKGSSAAGAVRGQLAALSRATNTTGALGSPVNLGAVGSAQGLYATLHALVVGTSATVVLESAPDNTFASPTTRGTFSVGNAVQSFWLPRVAGAITDTWFRFRVSAINGSFTFTGAIGIGS